MNVTSHARLPKAKLVLVASRSDFFPITSKSRISSISVGGKTIQAFADFPFNEMVHVFLDKKGEKQKHESITDQNREDVKKS